MAKLLDLTGLTLLVNNLKLYITKKIAKEVEKELSPLQVAVGNLNFRELASGETERIYFQLDAAPTSGNPIFVFGRNGWSTSEHAMYGLIYFEEDGSPYIWMNNVGGRYSAPYIRREGTTTYYLATYQWARFWFISPMRINEVSTSGNSSVWG